MRTNQPFFFSLFYLPNLHFKRQISVEFKTIPKKCHTMPRYYYLTQHVISCYTGPCREVTIPSVFVCLCGDFCSSREFFTHTETLPLPVKVGTFWPMLMANEQWGFLSVPNLLVLWHGESVCNVHLRGPVTLKTIAEHLSVELSRPVFTT